MARRKKKTSGDRKKQALGVLLFLVALVILVSLVTHDAVDDARLSGEIDGHMNPFKIQYRNQAGMLGVVIAFALLWTFGWLSFFVPLALILVSLRIFSSEIASRFQLNSVVLFAVAFIATMIYNIHILVERSLDRELPTVGGYVTEKLTVYSVKLVGELGSYIVLSGAILVLLVLFTSITIPALAFRIRLPGLQTAARLWQVTVACLGHVFSFKWLPSLFESDDAHDDEEIEEEEKVEDEVPDEPEPSSVAPKEERSQPHRDQPVRDKRQRTSGKGAKPLQIKSVKYDYPSSGLLSDNPGDDTGVDKEELNFTARMLRETLETFHVGIDGEIEKYPGPVITRFEFKPASGVKVNQIVNLSDDLALALKAKRIRIIAPIPGKAAVGVEIPNRNPQMVYIKDIFRTAEFTDPRLRLPLALGKTTSGKPYVIDLARLPHLLIAGATGSGKSVCLNVLITSLLYRLHPHQVRFILIDPKMLELSIYKGIPHLGRPVVTNPRRAEKVFADTVAEMEGRYRRLANASVRSIEDFNAKQTEDENKLPYIVIMVDELADLMMSSTSSKTELLITRLAQMARAVGIHLVLATQRPSVDVITGLIKANFPARIAFQVSSKVDSRTIIDANGAEKLLGNGDMLFLATGQPEPIRIHGPFISNQETEAIVDFIREQGLEPMSLDNISQGTGEVTGTEVDFGDPLFKEACEVVVRHKQGSVSLLQRRLGIGYQRAARLIDKLEQAGIVSTFDGSKAREVLVDKAYLDTILTGDKATSPANTNSN